MFRPDNYQSRCPDCSVEDGRVKALSLSLFLSDSDCARRAVLSRTNYPAVKHGRVQAAWGGMAESGVRGERARLMAVSQTDDVLCCAVTDGARSCTGLDTTSLGLLRSPIANTWPHAHPLTHSLTHTANPTSQTRF